MEDLLSVYYKNIFIKIFSKFYILIFVIAKISPFINRFF